MRNLLLTDDDEVDSTTDATILRVIQAVKSLFCNRCRKRDVKVIHPNYSCLPFLPLAGTALILHFSTGPVAFCWSNYFSCTNVGHLRSNRVIRKGKRPVPVFQ